MGALDKIKTQALTSTASVGNWHADDSVIDTPGQVAHEFGTTLESLQRWRSEGSGPPFVKLGRRKIGYPRGARREWLRTRMFNSTAEARLALNEQG